MAATRSHGLSGSDLSRTAEAAAVRPAPPDPEVLAKPPRASEPDTSPEPVQEGGDPLPPEGVRRILFLSSDHRPATNAGFSPARRPRPRCGVPGLYSIAWMPDELRSIEPGYPPVEGVEGKRSGASCGGSNHQVGEVSSALAVTTGCACDIASPLEHECFGGDRFVQHRRNAVTGKPIGSLEDPDGLYRHPRHTKPQRSAVRSAMSTRGASACPASSATR